MTVATPDTTTDQEIFTDLVNGLATPWQVIVWDDPVNTMEFVVAVFMKHFKLAEDVAMLRMLEVHQDGKSTLDCGDRDSMLDHKKAMNAYGLQATVEQPSA